MAGLSSISSTDSLSFKEMTYNQDSIDYYTNFLHFPIPGETNPPPGLDWDEDQPTLHPTGQERKNANLALGKLAARDPDVKALREAQGLTLLEIEEENSELPGLRLLLQKTQALHKIEEVSKFFCHIFIYDFFVTFFFT